LIAEKLGYYAAAKIQVMPNVVHRSHKGLNNRAENSHVPLHKRERMMQGVDPGRAFCVSSQPRRSTPFAGVIA
jgi:putative transposase